MKKDSRSADMNRSFHRKSLRRKSGKPFVVSCTSHHCVVDINIMESQNLSLKAALTRFRPSLSQNLSLKAAPIRFRPSLFVHSLFWIFILHLFACIGSSQATSRLGKFYFTHQPSPSTLTSSGGSATLDCAVFFKDDDRGQGSSSRPEIYWMRVAGEDQPGMRIVDNSRRYTLSNGSLHMESVTYPADTGYYRCAARVDGVGTIISTKAKLDIVYLRRQLVYQPADLDLALGDTAAFQCLAESRPQGQVTWFKGNRRVKLMTRDSDIIVYPTGMLEIRSIKRSDYDTYSCDVKVEGQAGSTRSRKAVLSQLSAADPKLEGAPKFIVLPRDQRVVEGETIYLHCVAYGRDRRGKQPSISWLKDGRSLRPGSPGSRLDIVGTGTLVITAVSKEDSGDYTCRAVNGYDTTDTDATLTVLVPPKILDGPTDMIMYVNDDVTLQCMTEGVPTPRVMWYKDSLPVVPGHYHQPQADGSLHIMGLLVSDEGMYQCGAVNEIGDALAEARVVVRQRASSSEAVASRQRSKVRLSGHTNNNNSPYLLPADAIYSVGRLKPPTPVNLKPRFTKMRYVTLQWSMPDDGSLASGEGWKDQIVFQVRWSEDGSERERVSNTTSTDFTISGLRPGTQYRVWVRAFNADGPSEGEASLTVTTLSDVLVPSEPQGLAATVLSTKELRVEWDPPSTTHGHILAYRIHYYQEGIGKANKTVSETFANLKGLEEYTKYAISVSALNSKGEGPKTAEVMARTFSDKPSAPPLNFTLEVSSATSLIVRWQPPALHHRNGVITGYKIRRRLKGLKKGISVTTAGDRFSYALTDLRKDTEYEVRVAAITANDTGPFTMWKTATTLKEVNLDESRPPGQPADLHTEPTATTIEVTWAPPLSPRNIVVRGYRIRYGLGIPNVFEQFVPASEERRYTIRNLKPEQNYIISVQAYNERGNGQEKLASVLTKSINEGPKTMSAPVAVIATVLSSSTVHLTWRDRTLDDNQLINDNRYYTITYRPVGTRSKKWETEEATELHHHIYKLRPYTEYEFKVMVSKSRLWSDWSMSVFATTEEKAPGSEPRDVTPVPLENNPYAVSLNWQPPAKPNGQISGYLIFYTNHLHTEDIVWPVEPVVGESLSVVIDNLTPDTTYFFKVQARNSKGLSRKSKPVKYQTPPAPETKPQGEAEDEAFTLSLPIIIGAGVGIAVLILACILGIVCLCRKKDSPSSMMTKTSKGPPSLTSIKPPDLWTHQPSNLELNKLGRSNRSESSASVATSTIRRGSRGSADHTDDQGSTLDRRRNSFMGEGGYPSSGEERYQPIQPRSLIRPKPVLVPVDAPGVFRDAGFPGPPSLLQYGADIPPGAPLPMRPIYPRTQYTSQYSGTPYGNPAPRVNAGDIPFTCPSSTSKSSLTVVAETDRDAELPASMEDSFTSRIGYVKPQPSISPYRKPSGPATTPTSVKGQRTPISFTSKIPESKLKKEGADLSKSLSTEELTAEMANLEGLMKDLNAITQQEFEC